MEKLKVLNLYAGIGGNRKLWQDVEVTSVEWDKETAKVYQDYFPDDEVIVGDAHQYLLEHFQEYDFIWSSPPCPTHSRINHSAMGRTEGKGYKPYQYPDMQLYEEIIFLDKWYKSKWVVENVIPYYEPLIPAEVVDRHLFWSNFKIGSFEPVNKKKRHEEAQIPHLQKLFGFNLDGYNLKDKRQSLRNCVHPETGKYILDRARDIIVKSDTEQTTLF